MFLKQHSGQNIFPFLSQNKIPTFSAACIKKELLLSCNFNSFYPPCLDFWLWRQGCLFEPIFFVQNSITYWRKHPQSYELIHHAQDMRPFIIVSNKLLLSKLYNSVPFMLSFMYLLRRKNLIIQQQLKYIQRKRK